MNILIMITVLIGCSNKVMKLKDKPLTFEQQSELNKQLIEASKDGRVEAARALIEGGADVNHDTWDGWTTLMWAASKGHLETISLLIQSGANVNQKIGDGWRSMTSIELGSVNIIKQRGNTALMIAACDGHAEAIKVLIEAGANVNIANKFGNTALMLAAAKGHVEAIRTLILAGAKVNKYNDDYWDTALMWASEHGHIEAVRELIVSGANVNQKTVYNWTALMSAAQEGHVEIVEALIQAGADVNAAQRNGWTALMIVAYGRCGYRVRPPEVNFRSMIVERLLTAGANIHCANIDWGNTALISASIGGDERVIFQLLEAGSNIHHINKDGETALLAAAKNDNLLPFMKAYVKFKLNWPEEAPDYIVVGVALSLLVDLLDTSMFINQKTGSCSISTKNINEFLLHPQLDLAATFTHVAENVSYRIIQEPVVGMRRSILNPLNLYDKLVTRFLPQPGKIITRDITIRLNPIESVYKNLNLLLFSKIYENNLIRDKMIQTINRWDINTKTKMLRAIFKKSNADKLNTILTKLTNTTEQDPIANEKRSALKEMVRELLIFKSGDANKDSQNEFTFAKENSKYTPLLYKVFEDEMQSNTLDDSIICLLHNKGWRIERKQEKEVK